MDGVPGLPSAGDLSAEAKNLVGVAGRVTGASAIQQALMLALMTSALVLSAARSSSVGSPRTGAG